jgi:rhamnosyltransferase
MILNKASKRIAIYFIYDKQGIIDDYIVYQLTDLKKNIDYLLIVVNGILTHEGRMKLKPLANEILVRDNKGFDVWAYKTGIEKIGWKNLKAYDELLLMNFTCFGPVYPFSEVFETMSYRDLGFWGITKHNKVDFDPWGSIEYGYIPEHIQSSFLCIRKSMFTDTMFIKYWHNMPIVNNYGEAVGKHEAIFTKKFSEVGFKHDLYVNTDDLKSDYTYYPLMFYPKELISLRRCPLFKRKSFTNHYRELYDASSGEASIELYDYIKNNTTYDVNMIWDNLLRCENLADIMMRLHLTFILPKNHQTSETNNRKKVALVFHLYYIDLIEETMSYIRNMPDYSDIYITTDDEEKKNIIDIELQKTNYKFKIIVIENRGRDISSLLIAVRDYIFDYDYICFAHDKKTTQVKPLSAGKSFAYKCLENTLGSKIFIENIVSTFEKEPRLGILMPSPPIHGIYNIFIENMWADNFENTKRLLNELLERGEGDEQINIDPDKSPIAPLGTMFWFRPEALKPLYKKQWKYEDFPEEPVKADGTILHAIERAYCFIAQAAGFYSGYLLNNKYAAIELTNWHYISSYYKRQMHEFQNSIINSRSWKLTEPLRKLKSIFIK